MHFALPPRKSSSPPPYARASIRSTTNQRRQQIQYLSYLVLCLLTVYLLYSWIGSGTLSHKDEAISADSTFLIVTVFDEKTMSEDYMTMIKANREDYASRHGYQTFYTNTSTYRHLYEPSSSTWAFVPALRHALTLNPTVNYIWSLTPHALITNLTLDLHTHILDPLPNLMLKDIPVVPPDSVIHTFSHIKSKSANLIISQDFENIAQTSFLLRNTLTNLHPAHTPQDTWTHFFLDTWFDPLYRAYAFQKAENHALEHIVQWHPTILAQLVVIPQRQFNSYNFKYSKSVDEHSGVVRSPTDSMWREGDLLVNFKGCEDSDQRDCEREMRGYFDGWKKTVESLDGKPPGVELKVSDAHYVARGKIAPTGPSDYELKRTHI